MTDGQIESLWAVFSDEKYAAGWMAVTPGLLVQFRDWLGRDEDEMASRKAVKELRKLATLDQPVMSWRWADHPPGTAVKIPVVAAPERPTPHYWRKPSCRNCGTEIPGEEDVDTCPSCLALAKPILDALDALTDENRKLVFDLIRDFRFCVECGRADPGCQCWNDD